MIFVPCTDGIRRGARWMPAAIIRPVWRTTTSANGPPVVGGGTVWSIAIATGPLYRARRRDRRGARPASGVGAVPHFASPTLADGLVLVGTMDGVTAIRAAPGRVTPGRRPARRAPRPARPRNPRSGPGAGRRRPPRRGSARRPGAPRLRLVFRGCSRTAVDSAPTSPSAAGMVRAADRAAEIGASALQVFTDNPTSWQPPRDAPGRAARLPRAPRRARHRPAVRARPLPGQPRGARRQTSGAAPWTSSPTSCGWPPRTARRP